jgi:hypothetical protein
MHVQAQGQRTMADLYGLDDEMPEDIEEEGDDAVAEEDVEDPEDDE